MSTDVNDILKKIITVKELVDFQELERKIAVIEEGFLFQNNRPTHVIMTIEKYEELQKKEQGAVMENVSIDSLETLLNKIGKKIFVDYYYVFKQNNNPEAALEVEGFTIASRRSRSSSARSIFKNNLQIVALNNIIVSDRVDYETIQKAKKILLSETGTVFEKLPSTADFEEQEVKIGKMMKGCLLKFIENGIISDYELEKFQSADYSKQIFNLNFPVLRMIKPGETLDSAKRDARGYNRYYDSCVMVNDNRFLICSQWVENLHKLYVETWIANKMADTAKKIADSYSSGIEFSVRDMLAEYWPYIDWIVKKRIGSNFKYIVQECSDIVPTEQKNGCQYYKKL